MLPFEDKPYAVEGVCERNFPGRRFIDLTAFGEAWYNSH